MNKESTHKAGFVNIIGKPNVGKSTLMNAMVGEKLSIITARAQTTRHRIHGILNGDDYQVVFADTPGILNPSYKLQEAMLKAARSALVDADILIYMTEIGEKPDPENEFLQGLAKSEQPVIVVINKIDLRKQEEVMQAIELWNGLLPRAEKIPVSAREKFNVDYVFRRILHHLPVSPPYYDKDALTDKSERFFAGEMIREKILLHYRQEIPYAVEVEIGSFKEDRKLIRIEAMIYVERDSQKGILIGNEGKALKRVGREARIDMEGFFQKKVFLELRVKVKKDWRNSDYQVKKFGYH
ncbi:MAG: GTPase Era [Bacteroidetes bacterium]|nr:MAG: GTPase Era [Bacteroidota bacterium]